MALIHCPECGREISDKAAACPGCGYPLGAAEAPASREASDRQRRLEEARAQDRQFLKRAGVLLLLGIAVILGLVILLARTGG